VRGKTGHDRTDRRRGQEIELGSCQTPLQERAQAGELLGGDFDYWPDEGCQAALDRIEREWIKAGADPNLAAPICWFAPWPG